MRTRGRPPHPDVLTPREWEVRELLRQGLTNRQIGERLGISLDGAKYHVSEIVGKLGVGDRHEAAAWQPTPVPWWRTATPAFLAWPFKNLGLVSSPGGAKLAAVPCAGVCAVPVVAGPLTAAVPAAGLAVGVLHGLLWVIAPLNILFLWFNYRRHHDARPLVLGALGVIFIIVVMSLHAAHNITDFESWPHDPLIWSGLSLLALGILLDWRAARRGVAGTVRVSVD